MQVEEFNNSVATLFPGLVILTDKLFYFCRYEAALTLRKECLEKLALGDVLQILNMVVSMKKWIITHHSGWQPISIALAES